MKTMTEIEKRMISDMLMHTRKIAIKWHEDDVEENTLYYPIVDIEGGWLATTNGNPITEYDQQRALDELYAYCPDEMMEKELDRLQEERECAELACATITAGYGEKLTGEDKKYIARTMRAWGVNLMSNVNWPELFKAELVKPVWAEHEICETEIPTLLHSIDACIGDAWRKDLDENERLFGNGNGNRPGRW